MLETATLDTAVDWTARHRQIWAERHDRLEEHLAALRARQRRNEEKTP